ARDGIISVYAETSAREGRYRGYVKPVVKNLDILKLKQESKSVGEAIKGFFVKIIANIFENKAKDQLATKIEFSGTFEGTNVSVWDAVAIFLQNAFVQALQPGLEGSTSRGPVGVKSGGDKKAAKEQVQTQKERERLQDK